jgi:hypothetical protein
MMGGTSTLTTTLPATLAQATTNRRYLSPNPPHPMSYVGALLSPRGGDCEPSSTDLQSTPATGSAASASSDGSPTQTASLPPCSTQRTSGAQSSGQGHSLPPFTNDGGDFNADYDPSHVGTCKQSGSSFEHVIAFSSSDDIAFSLPPTLHH